jgi:hypothetical protein
MDIMGSELLTDCNTFNRAADFMMKKWLLAQNVCKLSMFWHYGVTTIFSGQCE